MPDIVRCPNCGKILYKDADEGGGKAILGKSVVVRDGGATIVKCRCNRLIALPITLMKAIKA